jgi:hypothetical protein
VAEHLPLKEACGGSSPLAPTNLELAGIAPIIRGIMENRETALLQRYFRKVMAYPEGHVVHHGDCDFFNIKVCTCGLLHFLVMCKPNLIEKHYPLFYEEQRDYEEIRAELMAKGRKKK